MLCSWSAHRQRGVSSLRASQDTFPYKAYLVSVHRALVIAGLLIKFVPPGWRSFFYVLAGITGAAGLAGFFLIPGPLLPHRKVKGAAVDVVGAFLATSGLVLFVFALADGEGAAQGWKTPYIPACLVVGALLLAVFFRWESHLEKNGKIPPLMRVSLWKKGKFAVLQSIALCLFGCVPTYVPQRIPDTNLSLAVSANIRSFLLVPHFGLIYTGKTTRRYLSCN